jgi:hypothetical protein
MPSEQKQNIATASVSSAAGTPAQITWKPYTPAPTANATIAGVKNWA